MAQCFAFGSWIASIMAMSSCFYVFVRPIPEEGMPELPKEGFGWISRQIKVKEPPSYGKQCTWYSSAEREQYFDGMWNAGFAMAVLTVMVGLVVLSLVMCTCCVAFKMPMFDGLFWTCMLCFVAQCLTFLSWGSELCTEQMECTWSSGTGLNLTALMMWIWAANMVKSFPEALPPRKRRNRDRGNDQYDDDDGGGDVYLSNRNNNANDNDDQYEDEYNSDWDNADDNGDGYYDEDGNWVANEDEYTDGEGESDYDGYGDQNDDQNGEYDSGGYENYDNEDSSNWAGDSDSNSKRDSNSNSNRTGGRGKKLS